MLRRRVGHLATSIYAAIFNWLRPSEFLKEPPRGWAVDWKEVDADHFGAFPPMPWQQLVGEQTSGEHKVHGERGAGGLVGGDRPDMGRWDETRAFPITLGSPAAKRHQARRKAQPNELNPPEPAPKLSLAADARPARPHPSVYDLPITASATGVLVPESGDARTMVTVLHHGGDFG